MSRPSLQGCWEKLRRAENQLDTLDKTIQAFVDEGAHGITQQPQQRPNEWLFVFSDVKKLPLEWGVIVGEIVHNLRSALDHLVWQLIRLNKGHPTSPRQVQFPICDGEIAPQPPIKDVHYWSVDAPKMLSGVHADHVALIQDLQPYTRKRPRSDWLFILTELWNADKHRVIHSSAMSVPDELPSEVVMDVGGYPGTDFGVHLPPGKVKNGAQAVWLELTSAGWGSPREMHMRIKAPVQVAFGKRRLSTSSFRHLGWYISQEVLELFATDFPKPRIVAERPFHKPPSKPDWTTTKHVLIRPEDTAKRFSGWKVWLHLPEWRLVTQTGTQWEQTPPLWYFQSPSGLAIPVLAKQPAAAFKAKVVELLGEDAAHDVFAFFQPIWRETPSGWGVYPT